MKSFPSFSGLLVGENSTFGIGRLKRRMDDFATVQTKLQASLDSQTNMMHDLFSHFGINPEDLSLGEVPSGQVGVLTCLVSLPVFQLSRHLSRWLYCYRCHDY
jgi:hypothetical protein